LTEDRRQNSPQSVTRVIRILEMLSASPVPMGLAELSRALGTPKSSLAALLRGLADEDFVVPADGAFRLGPGAFGLGSALSEARRRIQSPEMVRGGLRRLAERTGETALFAVRDGDGVTLTYVDLVESRNTVRFAVSVGDRRPLYATAGGRMLLAGLPEEELKAYLASLKPEPLTKSTEINKTALAEAIAAARASGAAQTVDQAADGVTGTASLVRDAAGTVLGALIVAAPSSRSQDRRDELARLVKDEAAAISRSLGWRRTEAA
jgi:DNA-binding IclR family transcriptional regulator